MKKPLFIFIFVLIILNSVYSDDLLNDAIYNGNLTALNSIIEPGQLNNHSFYELRILRNMIYARYGYIFRDSALHKYFVKFPWYNGLENNVDNYLTEIDKRNIYTIRLLEYDPEEDFYFENVMEGNDKYSWDIPEIRIIKYKGGKKNVRIPPQIRNLPVTGIDYGAFEGYRIESVAIPYGVRAISDDAFAKNNLNTIYIPDSVIYIGRGAFADNRLVNVRLHDNIKYMGPEVFKNNKITEIVIPRGIDYIERRAFENNLFTNITLPNHIRAVGGFAFANNPLTSVVLPDTVEWLGIEAFLSDQLISITIGKEVRFGLSNTVVFDKEFNKIYYYDSNSSKNAHRIAGTYIKNNGRWVMQK